MAMVPASAGSMETVLRPLIVIGGSVLLTLAVGWLVDRALKRTDERHHETPSGACCGAAGYRCSRS